MLLSIALLFLLSSTSFLVRLLRLNRFYCGDNSPTVVHVTTLPPFPYRPSNNNKISPEMWPTKHIHIRTRRSSCETLSTPLYDALYLPPPLYIYCSFSLLLCWPGTREEITMLPHHVNATQTPQSFPLPIVSPTSRPTQLVYMKNINLNPLIYWMIARIIGQLRRKSSFLFSSPVFSVPFLQYIHIYSSFFLFFFFTHIHFFLYVIKMTFSTFILPRNSFLFYAGWFSTYVNIFIMQHNHFKNTAQHTPV